MTTDDAGWTPDHEYPISSPMDLRLKLDKKAEKWCNIILRKLPNRHKKVSVYKELSVMNHIFGKKAFLII